MRRHRQAKIVATVGPASSSPQSLRALFDAGVDVFRLNFSHGTHAEHRARYEAIRAIEREVGRPIGVLLDLQGPKLRVGTFANGPVQLSPGQRFRLDLRREMPGDARRVALPHPEIFAALRPGSELLIDDGRVRLRVTEGSAEHADTEVVVGGTVSDRKGVNVPDVLLPLSALTPKDLADLDFGLALGVDWVAMSFVQRPQDVEQLRELVQGRAGIMAKLEKPAAIAQLEEIVERCDALMVARGDLGVEMPAEQVPPIQKRIVRACRSAGKPVIVATQMLDSMVASPVPTRAEASDVATAIYDGADAVMLSAESASGSYPVEAVRMMDRIIRNTESDPYHRQMLDASHTPARAEAGDAIGCATRRVVSLLDVAAVVAFTSTGASALRMARERPHAPILGITPHLATARRLPLVWGVHAVACDAVSEPEDMALRACAVAQEQGFAQPGQTIVVTAGMPFGQPGTTNMLRIAQLR
jgi:pyruvate kinase